MKAEKARHAAALKDESQPWSLLKNLGKFNEFKQTMNPVRVLTSGPERVTTTPFFTNEKWRMCDRVKRWDEYTDGTPVVVGHYWRIADLRGAQAPKLTGGAPSLFLGCAPDARLGAKDSVFCVDFSIGGS